MRVISPARENESDRRIKNPEECIERLSQEIKKTLAADYTPE